MSEFGYLSKAREKQIARFLDGLIDFDELLKSKKKFLGLINVGSLIERKDRVLFEFMIAYLDDNILAKSMNEDLKVKIDKFYTLLENRDITGFIEYSSSILATVIDIPVISYEEEFFKSILMFTSGIINKSLEKVREISNKSEE